MEADHPLEIGKGSVVVAHGLVTQSSGIVGIGILRMKAKGLTESSNRFLVVALKQPITALFIVVGGRPRGRAVVNYTSFDNYSILNVHTDFPFVDCEEVPVNVIKYLPSWNFQNTREPIGEDRLLRGKRIPGTWVAASNYLAWALVSALLAWLC